MSNRIHNNAKERAKGDSDTDSEEVCLLSEGEPRNKLSTRESRLLKRQVKSFNLEEEHEDSCDIVLREGGIDASNMSKEEKQQLVEVLRESKDNAATTYKTWGFHRETAAEINEEQGIPCEQSQKKNTPENLSDHSDYRMKLPHRSPSPVSFVGPLSPQISPKPERGGGDTWLSAKKKTRALEEGGQDSSKLLAQVKPLVCKVPKQPTKRLAQKKEELEETTMRPVKQRKIDQYSQIIIPDEDDSNNYQKEKDDEDKLVDHADDTQPPESPDMFYSQGSLEAADVEIMDDDETQEYEPGDDQNNEEETGTMSEKEETKAPEKKVLFSLDRFRAMKKSVVHSVKEKVKKVMGKTELWPLFVEDKDTKPLIRHYRKVKRKRKDRYQNFAPKGVNPYDFTIIILQRFELYHRQLQEAQRTASKYISWGESVKAGRHMPKTIDAYVMKKRFLEKEFSEDEDICDTAKPSCSKTPNIESKVSDGDFNIYDMDTQPFVDSMDTQPFIHDDDDNYDFQIDNSLRRSTRNNTTKSKHIELQPKRRSKKQKGEVDGHDDQGRDKEQQEEELPEIDEEIEDQGRGNGQTDREEEIEAQVKGKTLLQEGNIPDIEEENEAQRRGKERTDTEDKIEAQRKGKKLQKKGKLPEIEVENEAQERGLVQKEIKKGKKAQGKGKKLQEDGDLSNLVRENEAEGRKKENKSTRKSKKLFNIETLEKFVPEDGLVIDKKWSDIMDEDSSDGFLSFQKTDKNYSRKTNNTRMEIKCEKIRQLSKMVKHSSDSSIESTPSIESEGSTEMLRISDNVKYFEEIMPRSQEFIAKSDSTLHPTPSPGKETKTVAPPTPGSTCSRSPLHRPPSRSSDVSAVSQNSTYMLDQHGDMYSTQACVLRGKIKTEKKKSHKTKKFQRNLTVEEVLENLETENVINDSDSRDLPSYSITESTLVDDNVDCFEPNTSSFRLSSQTSNARKFSESVKISLETEDEEKSPESKMQLRNSKMSNRDRQSKFAFLESEDEISIRSEESNDDFENKSKSQNSGNNLRNHSKRENASINTQSRDNSLHSPQSELGRINKQEVRKDNSDDSEDLELGLGNQMAISNQNEALRTGSPYDEVADGVALEEGSRKRKGTKHTPRNRVRHMERNTSGEDSAASSSQETATGRGRGKRRRRGRQRGPHGGHRHGIEEMEEEQRAHYMKTEEQGLTEEEGVPRKVQLIPCPLCERNFPADQIEAHAAECEGQTDIRDDEDQNNFRTEQTAGGSPEGQSPQKSTPNIAMETCYICDEKFPKGTEYSDHLDKCLAEAKRRQEDRDRQHHLTEEPRATRSKIRGSRTNVKPSRLLGELEKSEDNYSDGE